MARSHYRSSRDAAATPYQRARASFSMAIMALFGQGGPVDDRLASTHLVNMKVGALNNPSRSLSDSRSIYKSVEEPDQVSSFVHQNLEIFNVCS